MKYILAGGVSITAALIWQRILLWLNPDEPLRVGFLIPVGEELIKFGTSGVFGMPFFAVYLLFGLGEGIYEAFQSKKKLKVMFIVAGGLTHSLFGVSFFLPFSPWISLILAMIIHVIWNNIIIKMNRDF